MLHEVAPLLKYGKYCGILYSGCSGETPCDDLDACCMMHDQCVLDNNYNYLSDECSQRMMKCMDEFKNSGAPTFNGNKCEVDHVIELINEVMEAVLELRKVFPKP
ncbi:hypothetical protein Lal_00013933 [Lupinus albus]|nr:hypothetical protein Lal_00013933 [Lupinus albus]